MSWYASGLTAGEELFVNDISETGKPPKRIEFVEDIPCGIIVELFFGKHSYKRCLGWSAIYKGIYKVNTTRGQLKAKRVKQKGEWDESEGED